MKLKEIFDQLTYGELSQLSIGGGEQGVINEDNYDKVLAHLNLGLTALHKRFMLKEGSLNLQLVSGRTVYPLTSQYALSNRRSREETKYILDTSVTPFLDDILKIEQVYTESGYELPLNDGSKSYSVSTPNSTTLRVPSDIVENIHSSIAELSTSTLEIAYRANHPLITRGTGLFEPERVEVLLPYSHLEPLLLFIASRVHSPIGMVNEFNASNNYAAKYERACKDLETQNLSIDQGTSNTRIERNGWV